MRLSLKQMRVQAAKKRDEVRKSRTPQQQIAELDSRLGSGNGAKRERARLTAQMEKSR